MSELREIEDEMRQHPDPVVSVPELEDRMDMSDTTIRENLKLLEREGIVGRKDVGARATAWWHEDRVTPRHVAPEEHPDQSDLQDVAAADGAHSAGREAGAVTVEQAVAGLDLPGHGDKQELREEAMKDLLRHLRDAGETKGSDLKTLIHDHTDTGYETEGSWWTNCAHPALKELHDAGAVELVDRHRGVWAWAGGRDE